MAPDPAAFTKIYPFELKESELLIQFYFGLYLPFFCLPEICSRSRLKKCGSCLWLRQKKNLLRLRSRPNSSCSRRLQLRNTELDIPEHAQSCVCEANTPPAPRLLLLPLAGPGCHSGVFEIADLQSPSSFDTRNEERPASHLLP